MFAPVLLGYTNHVILDTYLLSTISFFICVAVLWLSLNIRSSEQELLLNILSHREPGMGFL